MRIAIIEDNESIAKGIAYRLEDRGHAADIISDGLAADEFLATDSNDLVILDISLPGLDGISILKSMRARADNRPVLLLTARTEIADRVAGLNAGADDYLVKPFEMDELEARVRALSRRAPLAIRKVFEVGALSYDSETREVEINGVRADMPRREVTVLDALIRARGAVVSKSELMEHLYGTGASVEESAVEVHISRLRKRVAPARIDIRSQRGLGYTLRESTDRG